MKKNFDVIVIGSGFGGAVTACRAAESGARVLVLERGRRWDVASYPRGVKDPWLFDSARPAKKNGWLDIRFFKRIYSDPTKVRQGIGPTISAKLDLMNGFQDGQRILIEDDGFPNVWLNALRQRGLSSWLSPLGWSFPGRIRRGLNEKNPLADVMVWLGSGPDAGDGTLRLKRSWFPPWNEKLSLDWSVEKSESLIESIIEVHRLMTERTGGKLYVPLFWRLLRSLITVHPLGGCRMGNTIEDGVVDHRGQVFGYPNLFVIDGAMVPVPIGSNPSLTIAALAERAAAVNY